MSGKCNHCGEPIAIRNPTGQCDHLMWTDNLTRAALIANGLAPRVSDEPIIAHESGHDFEVRVFFGQLGVRVTALDETGTTCDLPHLSADQARQLAARLMYAADQQDVF